MYRMLMVSILALVLTVSALAECPAAEKRALEQFDRAWAEAGRTGDRAALEQVFAADYMNLTPGAMQNKTQAIDTTVADAERARQNPNPPQSSYDHYIINCTPNTATITHRSATTTMVDGKETTNYARSVHVLEKRGGRWQVVSNAGHPLSDAAMIMYKELEWTDADLRSDVAWFEKNLASDYTGISSRDGKLMRRAEEIQDIRNRKDRIETAETTDLNVRMEGDVGIATGVYHVTGRDEAGKPFDRRIRFVDTYVKRDGKWQPLVSQGTRIQ